MSVMFNGRPHWYNVDKAYDFLLEIGMQPLVELSFMPKALAGCDDVKLKCEYAFDDHGGYKGLTMPPQRWQDWYDLVYQFTEHLVSRYGLEEVQKWEFEVWNELWGMDYPSNYLPLYNASALAVKAVHPSLKVGGPATMQCQEVESFIADTARLGLPVDFVSTHLYPSDPECTNTTSASQEADCFVRVVKRVAAAAHKANLPFYLTEFNDGLQDGTHRDTSFAAAYVFRMVPQLVAEVDLLSWWTWSDIFEEQWFDSVPFHNGFGLMTINKVPKPVFRAFELLAQAGKERLSVSIADPLANSRPSTVTSFATAGQEGVQVFVANWDVLDNKLETRRVTISLANLTNAAIEHVEVIEINDSNVNPYASWVEMGRPEYPSHEQVKKMELASEMAPHRMKIHRTHADSDATISLELPAYGVAVIRIPMH